jgi:hypothetical protein
MAFDAEVFLPLRVATYNVGASQERAFESDGKIGPFREKLVVSSEGETGGRAGIHHPKGLPRGRAHPSGAARGPSGGGYLMSDRRPPPSRLIAAS